MQPYFAPYAGYFRLIEASDVFVVYDCVQFPRRGWVHRNKLPDATGEARWFTLPLAKAPQETAIRAMRFSDDVSHRMDIAARGFPDLADRDHPLVAPLFAAQGNLSDWLAAYLKLTCRELGQDFECVRSSELDLPDDLKGQARIIEIVRRLGGGAYVNSPGGTGLYDAGEFRRAGIELGFLTPYDGDYRSILHRLRNEDASRILDEIRRQSSPQPA